MVKRGIAPRTLWLCVGSALVLLPVAIAVANNTSTPPARHVASGWIWVRTQTFASAGCKHGAAITSGFYDLGAAFQGLQRSSPTVECMPARSRIAVDGPLRPVGYVYVTYGSCDYRLESCLDPLEIQTWPECARDPNSYTPERGPSRGQKPALNPSELVKISSDPELPATSFEGGTRIELYGGGSTVVIFAPNVTLGKEAARALAHEVFLHASPTTAARLDTEAGAPGNAIACHHLLMSNTTSREQQ